MTPRLPAADDVAADRRFALTAAFCLVTEVVIAAFADAGAIAIWLWCVLALVAIAAAAVLYQLLGRRSAPRQDARRSSTR